MSQIKLKEINQVNKYNVLLWTEASKCLRKVGRNNTFIMCKYFYVV